MKHIELLSRLTRILPKADAFRTVAVLLIAAGLAQAGTITYIESATASGSLGGTDFTDRLITFTMVGDTSGILSASDAFANPGTLTLDVAGVGFGTFTGQTAVADSQDGGFAGFREFSPSAYIVLDTIDAAFASYALGTAIGPITGTGGIDAGQSFATTDGAFVLDSVGDSTFTATTAPEPGTFMLFGLGLAGFAGLARMRRRGRGCSIIGAVGGPGRGRSL